MKLVPINETCKGNCYTFTAQKYGQKRNNTLYCIPMSFYDLGGRLVEPALSEITERLSGEYDTATYYEPQGTSIGGFSK